MMWGRGLLHADFQKNQHAEGHGAKPAQKHWRVLLHAPSGGAGEGGECVYQRTFEHVEKKRKAEDKQATVAKKRKFKDLRAAEKAMQKDKQKADNDEAKKKGATAPKKRVLPAQSTRGKAALKEVDLPQKKDEPAPKEDLSQKTAEPAPKKRIQPIKTASLQKKSLKRTMAG
jgi:hypothetical protein